MRVLADRYALEVAVPSRTGAATWRAHDQLLGRPVTVLLLPNTDPRARSLRSAAMTASGASADYATAILDVVSDDADGGFVAVVTDWEQPRTLADELANGPLSAEAAVETVANVARAIAGLHAQGQVHGRIRPHNIVLQPRVRLAGLGVEAALLGVDEGSARTADVRALGNLLFAALTGIWPTGPVDGLPGPPLGAANLVPSSLSGMIPAELDNSYRRITSGTMSADQVAAALTEAPQETQTPSDWWKRSMAPAEVVMPRWAARRSLQVAAALGGVVVFGWLGLAIMTMGLADPASEAAANPLPTSEIVITTAGSAPPSTASTPIAIAAVTDFDPKGSGEENRPLVGNAIDGDPNTAWQTVTYADPGLDGKTGVGLRFDLGKTTAVREVAVTFTAGTYGAAVYVTDNPDLDPDAVTPFAQNSSATGQVAFTGEAAKGRYVLVWLTALPKTSNGWQGGIAEVAIRL